jgi:lipopolysaccharide transport system permease protein
MATRRAEGIGVNMAEGNSSDAARLTLGSTTTTVIEPVRGWVPTNLGEVWKYRELLYFFIWRDIKVTYRQTLIGAAWAVIQPVMAMIVFTVFFGRLAKMPSDGLPYPLFVLAALVPWMFFSRGLALASDSLAAHSELITKVYFPRMLVPAARILSCLPDLAVSFLALIALMWWYGVHAPVISFLWLPALVLLAFVTALGPGLWLAALNVKYRDIRHVVPFLIQLWMFATPIAYPASLLSEPWRTWYGLNPMVGVVEGFRWILLGSGGGAPRLIVAASAIAALVVLVTGAFFFRRLESTFADVI